MTRLFGCICNQPQRINEVLEPVRDVLVAKPPVSRWGLGYVQSGQVLLSRNPRAAEEPVDFFAALDNLESDYVIAATSEPPGLKGSVNTQPFRFRNWLFALEVSYDTFEGVSEQLTAHIPDYLKRNIKGKMPAEQIFHLFLSMLHDSGKLDDPNLSLVLSRRALRDALAFVYSLLTKSGVEASLGNLIVTNSRSMLAVRLAGPLHVRRLKHMADPKRAESELRAVVTVSGGEEVGALGEGFEEIPMRSVVAIGRDVAMDILDLDS
jgi:glutamine amidotransferase